MKAIDFPQANIRIAEHQDEYHTLPASIAINATTCCMELSDRDIQNIVSNRKLWLMFMKPQDTPLTPFNISFMDDVYDEALPEARWAFDSEGVEVETMNDFVHFTEELKLTLWQRIKHVFRPRPYTVHGKVKVISKYTQPCIAELTFKQLS